MDWAVVSEEGTTGKFKDTGKKREKKIPEYVATLDDLEIIAHLNNAAIGRIKSSRRLWTVHQTTKVCVGNDVTHRVLDRRLVLFPLTTLKDTNKSVQLNKKRCAKNT